MNIKVCDFCKNKNKQAYKKSFFKERTMDAAGSMENTYETLDLCVECELLLYQVVMYTIIKENPSLKAPEIFIDQIKRRKIKDNSCIQ